MDRKELRQPDRFQQTILQAGSKLVPHGQKLVAVIVGIVALAAIAWGWSYQRQVQVNAIQARLGAAELRLNEQSFLAEQGMDADWAGVISELEAVYADARGTVLHRHVLFSLYRAFVARGDYDAAIDVANELRNVVSGNRELQATALYASGKAHELKGEHSTAVAYYEQAAEASGNPLGDFMLSELETARRGAVAPGLRDQYLVREAAPELDRPTPRLSIPLDGR